MKNWIKKQKYKFAIALCSILSIFTLFLGINNIYAYESTTFSYTCDTTNYTFITINNISGVVFDSNNENFQITKNSINARDNLLLNYYILDTNNNFVTINSTLQFRISNTNGSSFNNVYIRGTIHNDNNMYTLVSMVSTSTTTLINGGTIRLITISQIPSGYKLFISNVDVVDSTQIGLQQYYDTYYGQIEDNYNTLLDNYNDLQEDYSTLETNYNTLESNYNDLDTNYNNLQDNYDDLENDYNSLESSYESLAFEYNDLQSQFDTLENALSNLPNYNGMQSFIDSFNGATFELYGYAGISGKIENSPTFTLSNFNNSNFNLSRDTDTFYTWIQNNINTYGGFDLIIVLNVPYTTSLSCSFSNTNYNHTISIYSEVNGLAVATYDDYNNESVILINDTNNYSIVQIRLSLTQQDYDFILSSNIYGDQYMNGYNNGYNQSLIEWNSELNTARNTIESQRNTIRTLQQQLNTANQYDLNKLMWTIGSTPFESFKQIWNVNFFGVNISTMITGFITGIIVLWIIKKFFL